MDELLAGLNDPQREAVSAGYGPVLVLAGPGSGKTRVLTHRIAYLIRQMGVPPYAIMAVTFTNKAAGEMRTRVEKMLGERMRGLQIGTFHAACAGLLRKEGQHTPFGPDYVIYDTDDQLAAVRLALSDLSIDPKRNNPRGILSAISNAKNELISAEEYHAVDYFSEIVRRVYARYQAILLDSNALDFDDLLMQTVVLLQESPPVLEKYQHRFEFVLVDEFQDTNTAQYRLVELLAAPQNNAFVVGDEDQSIYAFRGADFRNVLRFKESYQNARVILLEQNYRSTQVVLDVARAVIEKNPHRIPKALFTTRKGGEKVRVEEYYDPDFEARHVVDTIQELIGDEGLDWSDFAVMYRTNAQSRAIEEVCVREGIPYKLVGGVGFYQRREIRDLLAYLRLVHNGNDKMSFARIVNVPARGIGKKSLTDFQQWAAIYCAGYDDALQRLMRGEPSPISARAARQFADFGNLLSKWRTEALSGHLVGVLDAILHDITYTDYLKTISDNEMQLIERGENIHELRQLIAKSQDEGLSLSEFLVEQSLMTDLDTLDPNADAITLLTLHAAKGLEYPVVFITGIEEGLLPHSRALEELEGVSEERRLFYVGITRAKDRLYLTHTFRRSLYGSSGTGTNLPSRFLSDMPDDLIEGLSPRASLDSEAQNIREQTRWNPVRRNNRDAGVGEENGDEKTGADLKEKFPLRFPGVPNLSPNRFSPNQRVMHEMFGRGVVLESKQRGGIEYVTVAFKEDTRGIKLLDAATLEHLVE